MKYSSLPLIALACLSTACSTLVREGSKLPVLGGLAKTIAPQFLNEAPADATVPENFPVVKRIVIEASSTQKQRVREASSFQNSAHDAYQTVESQLRQVLSKAGYEVIDRDETERQVEEAEYGAREDEYYDSLGADAILFWESANTEPNHNRRSDGTVSSTSDVRVDLMLKGVGEIQGESSAWSNGTATWMGAGVNSAEIVELHGICAKSASQALTAKLKK